MNGVIERIQITKVLPEPMKSREKPKEVPIVVLQGEQKSAGNEVLQASLRVLRATGLPLAFEEYDLGLENRSTNPLVIYEAAEALQARHFGIKSPTKRAVGEHSPNVSLRQATKADVIVRTARPYPGTPGVNSEGKPFRGPITVVRMAHSEKKSKRRIIEDDEVAKESREMTRSQSQKVAEFAFRYARKHGGVVFGGPDRANDSYDGMLRQEIFRAAGTDEYKHKSIEEVAFHLYTPAEEHIVIPALERDGNILSFQAVAATRGTLDTTPSTTLTLDDAYEPRIIMTDMLNDSAVARLDPDNTTNPMGMILAGADLLSHMRDVSDAKRASEAIYKAVNGTLQDGVKTKDLDGKAGTKEFTDEVVRRVQDLLKPVD